MNPTCYKPTSISISVLNLTGVTNPTFCRMKLGVGRDIFQLNAVHVPEDLQEPIASGNVLRICSETLKLGGVASRLLPGEPTYLVTGVLNKDGSLKVSLPSSLSTARKRLFTGSLGLGVLGTLLLAVSDWTLLAGLFFMASSHLLRSGVDIPTAKTATKMLSW